jgi:hypothetical protein
MKRGEDFDFDLETLTLTHGREEENSIQFLTQSTPLVDHNIYEKCRKTKRWKET